MAARVGYAVSGLLHLLIGWLALQVAWSNSGKSADQSGALASLAGNGLGPGRACGWPCSASSGLALWQVAEAIGGYFGEGMDAWAGRGKAMAKAVVYLVLGWTTLSFARGKHVQQQAADASTSPPACCTSTAGRVLVVVIGLVVVGVGVYHVYKGATKKFLRDLAENPGTFATRAGQIGYIAKGIALAIVGLLFVVAGVTRRARPPGAWTPPCTRCATSRWARCCSPSSRSGWWPTASTASPAPATRGSERPDTPYGACGRRPHAPYGQDTGVATRAGRRCGSGLVGPLAQELLELGADLVGARQLADVRGQQAGLLAALDVGVVLALERLDHPR